MSSGSMVDIGTLAGWRHSTAYGINDAGQIVGQGSSSVNDHVLATDPDPGRAFLLSGGAMQDLGALPGQDMSAAYGINSAGQVVGTSFNSFPTDARAFMWSSDSGMTDLSALPDVTAAGWSVLVTARAINDSGQIVGWGVHNGLNRAYLLSPFDLPPPTSSVPAKTAGACPSSGQSSTFERNKPNPCPTGNPVNPFTGNKYQIETDYAGAGVYPLRFQRYYNSNTGTGSGHIGVNWRHSFDRSIAVSGTSVTVTRPDGKGFVFSQNGTDWVGPADIADRLVQTPSGWIYTVAPDDDVESYDTNGRLLAVSNRSGASQVMAYDPAGRLSSVTDSVSGRSLQFTFSAAGQIVSMTDPAGKAFTYSYDATGNLVRVTYPDDTTDTTDNPMRTYVYNESTNTSGVSLPNTLTGIVDENSARFATYQYGTDGRVASTEHGGASRYSVLYFGPGLSGVIDPLGTFRFYFSQTILDVPKHTGVSQPCDGCGLASSISYDANGHLTSATDYNGVAFNYVHDARGLETSRVEAVGTPQARTISTQWHGIFRLPVKVAEPLKITTYVYNGDAGQSCGSMPDGSLVPGVLCSRTIQGTSDATGANGFSASPTGPARTWRYTYNLNGSMLTMDGPRIDVSDVTTYTYYANDDPDPGKRGNIATITNALGQVTRVTAYNAHGQPLTVVDPNGLTTQLTYDARLRIATRSVGGETTSYGYDAVGQLVRVTLADGSFLAYTYDLAHRLTALADNLGNRIVYTLDPMGNQVKQELFDPSGALVQTRSRVFDQLSRLASDIGSQNQTINYGYDSNGNRTSVTDPLNRLRSNNYDALNHLVSSVDPANGTTSFGYDGADELTSVTDPRGLVTTYSYDGLANLLTRQSPDTGAASATYDEAGNPLTRTDAKGQVTSYAYDALNRVTSISFADGAKQIYTYDHGANALGRLTRIAELDPIGNVTAQLDYAYEPHGRVASDTRTLNGVAYVLAYAYDSAGRLGSLTYPSGRLVTYQYDPVGRVNQVSTTPPNGSATIAANNVTYQPFGRVKSYTLGNGQTYTRTYDLDGRIDSYTLGLQQFLLGYDAANRISFLSDAANPPGGTSYGYDALDRLTAATLPNVPYAYGYDAVGNRTSKTVGSSTDTYSYDPASNRIASIAAQAGAVRIFASDPNGSTSSDGVNQYAYDARGRMVQSVSALGATSYQVNALGQRVRKSNSTDDRIFLYDTRGRLIGEADPGGTVKREYLYLNDTPLAVIQ
ncbi:MAG TPA: DUF6531 domain-containing protein [Gemmatimonadaceae bacterium]|nr:DUF6531 domain-containing protein [Gemmatimonadaceae bacterium]